MNISGVGHLNQAHRQTSEALQATSERIASGSRINHAGDDAAGLVISRRMTSAIDGFSQSIRNANDGVSMLQIAESGLSGITDGIGRIRELALQASNGILTKSDRAAIQKEAQSMLDEIQRSVSTSSFNQKPVLSGADELSLQLGESADSTITLSSTQTESRLQAAGLYELDLSSVDSAMAALQNLDAAQTEVDTMTSDIGASLNRLDSSINQMDAARTQSAAARSRIADSDMAEEITNLVNQRTKEDISITLQAIANQQSGNVLRLLEAN